MILKDKVILVTGATTGIGAAIAKRCVQEGAKVMVHGQDEQRAKEIVQRLGGEQAAYALGDLTANNTDICRELVAKTIKTFGRIDSLINNAAKSPRNDIDSLTDEKFDWIIRLDLRAPLFLSQAAVKAFRNQKSNGTIVNIGSINAYCGQSDLLGYAIAKGGLMTMTRNLGNALSKEGIRVNQLNVGWTLTENESELKQKEGFPKHWENKIPLTYAPSGRLVRPEEVAAHVVFWASSVSAPANGVVYELEQYPVIGRNLINELPLDLFKEN